jgi:hypothetical protein
MTLAISAPHVLFQRLSQWAGFLLWTATINQIVRREPGFLY